MFFQKSTVDYSLFLVGVGVQIASYIFHAVQDMPGLPLMGSLEDKVFHKVGHTLLVRLFIACAGINGITAVSNICRAGCMNDTKSVRQGKSTI